MSQKPIRSQKMEMGSQAPNEPKIVRGASVQEEKKEDEKSDCQFRVGCVVVCIGVFDCLGAACHRRVDHVPS